MTSHSHLGRREYGSRDLYTRLVSACLFPLHEALKGHSSVAARRALEQSQWWPLDRLEAFRVERLRSLLLHAQEHVPYYRDVFRKLHIDADTIRGVRGLEALPLLTKGDIRTNFDKLKSEQAVNLSRSNTGGSSGEPLIFLLGNDRVSHDVAAKWRATRWWGVDIGDPEVVVWGSPIEVGAQDRLRAFRDRLFRTQLLPAFEMTAAKLDQFVARIRASRPRMLFGYPSSLALIARHAQRSGIRMDGLGIRVAFVTSERLYDHQREEIGRIFGCRVANGYGGRDAGFLAHECPAGGMHITAEDVILETIGPAGKPALPGEPGEIVVTHLASKDFPFIRYRTGDVGVLDDRQCPCGRGLPLLKEVQGRTTDFVVALDGTVMHGLALIYVLRELPGIREFKIVQESRSRTRVMMVPGEQYDEAIDERITRGLRARLGEVEIAIEKVAEIPADPSGKFRYVQSHVPVE